MPKEHYSELQKAVEIPADIVKYNEATDLIGGGAFGEVFSAVIKGIPVAVKVPRNQNWTEQELEDFKKEVRIMKSIYHTNVVLFLGACTTGKIMIITEQMLCDVDTLIHNRARCPPQIRSVNVDYLLKLRMMHDASLGICWLHDILKMVHRDLKPANFLLDENFHVKICDFGFTEHFKATRAVKMKGTALYSAPEIWEEKACTFKSDVYSFGLILWEVYTEQILFKEYDDLDPFCEDVIEGGLRPPLPAGMPRHYAVLMRQCWDGAMDTRPTMDTVRTELEALMVESVINDQKGRDFWKRHFGGDPKSSQNAGFNTEVSWQSFVKAVLGDVDLITARELDPLRTLLYGQKRLVTMDRFNIVTSWFGEFFDKDSALFLLDEVSVVLKAPWFFNVTKEDAELMLVNQDPGCFLIRLSTNDPVNSPFTLSRCVKAKDGRTKTVHKRINRVAYADVPKRYMTEFIDEDRTKTVYTWATLPAMVEQLKTLNIITVPCTRKSENNYDGDYL